MQLTCCLKCQPALCNATHSELVTVNSLGTAWGAQQHTRCCAEVQLHIGNRHNPVLTRPCKPGSG
eukprot:5124459-Amphidinium_carterae.1